ncbi:coenzyme Q biosynthesis protein Coq4-domain-containing protein [Hyaloraphidium curvatum]|nr:coenzyme Q biosynthesis protein Coq4-domain-containing protein [Hyaloraphidium curvatum]
MRPPSSAVPRLVSAASCSQLPRAGTAVPSRTAWRPRHRCHSKSSPAAPPSLPPPPPLRHVPITPLQRALYAVGSAVTALVNPLRGDMVAVLGETTGTSALRRIRDRMLLDRDGRRILRERPRIGSATVDIARLRSLPPGTFGRAYADWLDDHGVTPDTRMPVMFVEDAELAYVLQRYREVHDFWHALTGIGVTVEAELALKWFEMVQTGLPMTVLASLAGPLNLRSDERARLFSRYVPWAVSAAADAKFLMNVYYEELFDRDLGELQKELGIATPPAAD